MKPLFAMLIAFAYVDGSFASFLGTFGLADYSTLVALVLSAAFVLPLALKRLD